MGKTSVIDLGADVELVIEEPDGLSSADRALAVTSACVREFGDGGLVFPCQRSGSFPVTIAGRIYSIYYQVRVKRVINALTVYSETIKHIQNNPHLYDSRLATKAIDVLRECFRSNLR
jgi:hypothetical protein